MLRITQLRNGSTEMLGTLPKTTQFIHRSTERFANKCLISHSSEVEAKRAGNMLKSHSLELEAQRHKATLEKIIQLRNGSTEGQATFLRSHSSVVEAQRSRGACLRTHNFRIRNREVRQLA